MVSGGIGQGRRAAAARCRCAENQSSGHAHRPGTRKQGIEGLVAFDGSISCLEDAFKRQALRRLAAVLLCIAASGCNLLGPEQQTRYVLVRVNGISLPYSFHVARSIDGNHVSETRWVDGSIVLNARQITWDATAVTFVDGVLDSALTDHDHHVASFERADSTLTVAYPLVFIGHLLDGGRILSMKDQTGYYESQTFEFERR